MYNCITLNSSTKNYYIHLNLLKNIKSSIDQNNQCMPWWVLQKQMTSMGKLWGQRKVEKNIYKNQKKSNKTKVSKIWRYGKEGEGYFTFCLSDSKLLPNVISLTNVTEEGLFCWNHPSRNIPYTSLLNFHCTVPDTRNLFN